MRKPVVENKYGLKFSDIHHFVVLKPDELHNPPFWRNEAVQSKGIHGAWCLSGDTAESKEDELYGTYSEYWIGFYDSGTIEANCSSYGGMRSCSFEKFFDPKDIDNEIDLRLEELLLRDLNWLLDNGIVGCRRETDKGD